MEHTEKYFKKTTNNITIYFLEKNETACQNIAILFHLNIDFGILKVSISKY